MSVRRRQVGEVVVVEVCGHFYGGRETGILERVLFEEIELDSAAVLVNLSECMGMNSTAIGALFRAHDICQRRGGSIKFCCAAGRMKSLLALLRAGTLLDQYLSEDEALAAFTQRATA
jgi:anti-anti-sigma factor